MSNKKLTSPSKCIAQLDTSFNFQATNPRELPIIGSVLDNEIELKIESETHKYFQLNGKKLELTRPLNRDPILREVSSNLGFKKQLHDHDYS